MKKIALAAALLCGVSSAQAQTITGHFNSDGSFHGHVNSPSGGFAGGFANGLAGAVGGASAGVELGSYLPGTIVGPSGQLQFEIQVSLHGGGARAFDPDKRETFSGVYTIKQDYFFLASSNVSLAGDRGSHISCDITIHEGPMPSGNGDCVDRKNRHYQLQF